MTMRLGIVLLASVVSLSPAWADVISNFDTDAEGWVGMTADLPSFTMGATYAPTYAPGGYISFADPNSSDTFFRAPAAYLGNLLQYRGGSLSWLTFSDLTPNYIGPLVVLKGSGMTLVYTPASQLFSTSFAPVSVTLAPGANWAHGAGGAVSLAQFNTVLGSVDELWLNAETYFGVAETVAIDEVVLHSVLPPLGVPEPVDLSLLALSVGGAAMLARQRRVRV